MVAAAGSVAGRAAKLNGVKRMARNVEEPAYTVVDTYASFEVRLYEETIQARVRTDGQHYSNATGGFRRIAGYIFGGNQRNQRIAMTAPVHMWAEDGEHWMAFTMPAALSREQLPAPNDEGVLLVSNLAGHLAVLAFSGRSHPEKVAKKSQRLLDAVKAEGMEVTGEVVLAVYNNPNTTLPFMRRNEVMVPVLPR